MKSFRTAFAASAASLAQTAGFSGHAQADDSNNINLSYSGVAVPNAHATPVNQDFTDWCTAATGACFPTVQQPVYDMASGKKQGMVYIWGAFPFHSGPTYPGSLCFSEYMIFELDGGQIVTHTPPNGTCGAYIDPSVKPPLASFKDATAVVAGGGDGVIASGTGAYKGLTGTFTDRVFVGFGLPTSGVNGIIYYDQLIFSIFGKPAKGNKD